MAEDLKVFITASEAACDECGEELGRRAWITLVENKGALCLACADLEHLVFLPSGDAALTRRGRKHSTLAAVVLKWSRARKRYERQGLLVESQALDQAEEECLSDSEARARRREREAERRAEMDRQYVERFAARVRELFPGCPGGREVIIAEHACLKYSGRVGRSAAAKSLDETAVRLAVIAHIRHTETRYDSLLAGGSDRYAARAEVEDAVDGVLQRWEAGRAGERQRRTLLGRRGAGERGSRFANEEWRIAKFGMCEWYTDRRDKHGFIANGDWQDGWGVVRNSRCVIRFESLDMLWG